MTGSSYSSVNLKTVILLPGFQHIFFSVSLQRPKGDHSVGSNVPCSFPIDFLEKPAGENANGDHMFMGHLAIGRKCERVARSQLADHGGTTTAITLVTCHKFLHLALAQVWMNSHKSTWTYRLTIWLMFTHYKRKVKQL